MNKIITTILIAFAFLSKVALSIRLSDKKTFNLPNNSPAIIDFENVLMTYDDKYMVHITHFDGIDEIDLTVYNLSTGAYESFDETDLIDSGDEI